jgi:GxxExxY protein
LDSWNLKEYLHVMQDPLTGQVIGCAIEVHRHLGPGLLESAYETCLARELRASGCDAQCQLEVPIHYRDVVLDCGYRIDLLVEDQLVVELKAVDKLLPIHEAQLLTYMKLSGMKTGLLINFNVPILRDGIKRMKL